MSQIERAFAGAAVIAGREFAARVGAVRRRRGLFGRKTSTRRPACTWTAGSASGRPPAGVDLARVAGPKAYGTFVEITYLVGALGSWSPSAGVRTRRLLAIDEFELDDPGDTTLVSRLLTELTARGRARGHDIQHVAGQARRGPVRRGRLRPRDPPLAARSRSSAFDGPTTATAGLPDAPDP